MTVVTRFAPSPTGYLHIGSARTALFNFLYARHTGGKFLLRIEDTDKERSTQVAVDAILEGLKWLEISHDGEIVFQSKNIKNHQKAADDLVKLGKAYYCLTSAEEINQKREVHKQEGKSFIFESEWRNKNLTKAELPAGAQAVVRLKVDRDGATEINDLVQGVVSVNNDTLDDMVLLRSDGTPTYMLAVVVDDHEAGVTHVIRGDDHLSNTFRQLQIYKALNWPTPQYAHIPLIHGQDGAKLSKRHGAIGVESYRDMGFLQEALNNYLLRLGWGHGDDEIISRENAIKWFDIVDVNKGAARMDFEKMLYLNSHYIKHSTDEALIEKMKLDLDEDKSSILLKAMPCLKNRAKTLVELAEQAQPFIADEPIPINQQAAELLQDKILLQKVYSALTGVSNWDEQHLKISLNDFCNANNMKMGQIGPALRAALMGTTAAPGIFDIMVVLGKEKSLSRIGQVSL